MSPDRERWYRVLFWVAAIYDLALGVVFLFFYRPAFSVLEIEDALPEYTSFLSLIAVFLFVIGVAYVFIARGDLVRNRDLIAVGVLYKLAYFSVALWYLIGGVYPRRVRSRGPCVLHSDGRVLVVRRPYRGDGRLIRRRSGRVSPRRG